MPYKIHAVNIDVDTGAASSSDAIIPDCTNESLNNNPTLDAAITAGEFQPKHIALVAQSIMGGFTTFALPTVIDVTGLKALCIGTTVGVGVAYYLQKFDACGDVSTSSDHRSLTATAGVIVPRRITCDHQGHAQIEYDIVVAKNDSNDAIVISDTVSMPTIPATAGSRWTLGGVSLGGNTISDYTRLEVDLGNTVETRGSQSDIWDAYIEVRTHAPVITLTGIDPTWFADATIPIGGLACTHANTTIYLRKRTDDGTGFVSDATAEHIAMTAAGLATVQQPFTGDPTTFTETGIQINCLDDGSNDPIVIDTATAIT